MKILFVALPGHPHTMRWITQLEEQNWDCHLFPSTNDIIHPSFKNVTVHYSAHWQKPEHDPSVKFMPSAPRNVGQFRPTFVAKGASYVLQRSAMFWRAAALARVIQQVKPDVINSLEMQHAGYLTMRAKQILRGHFPPWIVTNWGSDIYLFQHQPEHLPKIKRLLKECDYYSCECERDVELALKWGLDQRKVLATVPVGGSYDVEHFESMRQGKTSDRRLILLKGYHGWAGRAIYALEAIKELSPYLQGYRVGIFLADLETMIAADKISRETGIPIEIIPRCSHDEIMSYFGKARIYVGLSISDGISISMLDAMVMGAFPIQTSTACADEWVRNGETGFIVPLEDPQTLKQALHRAIQDDAMVDNASTENLNTAKHRLDKSVLIPEIVNMYEHAANP